MFLYAISTYEQFIMIYCKWWACKIYFSV